MESRILKRGLYGFDLKIIALVVMVFSHIHEFFTYTGYIPEWFQYIGNIAEPLFLFMVVEGFIYTSSRKRYISRMYIIGLCMSIANLIINTFIPRGDGMTVRNNIIFPYMMVLVFLLGINYIKEKKYGKGILLVCLPVIGELFIELSYIFLLSSSLPVNYKWWIMSGIIHVNPFSLFMGEVGIDALAGATVLYLFRNRKNLRIAAFCIVNIIWALACIFVLNKSGEHNDYFAAEIFVQPVVALCLYLYNGKRGRSAKNLFYIFYPAHIYLFYFISLVLYSVTN